MGRSGFLVRGEKNSLLLDFGALTLREPAFPINVHPKDVDAVLLTHAHLDHTGAAPVLYVGEGVDLYGTPVTLELARLLIRDFLKISGFYLPYEFLELNTMMKKSHSVNYNERLNVGEFEVNFHDAGHIPGSASLTIAGGDKRILYTGDMNTSDTRLLSRAYTDWGEVDFVITECTYGTADHPPRKGVEKELTSFAKEIVESGGTLLVPAFSVARAQEIAMILHAHNFRHRVAMDGMALQVNEILGAHPDSVRDHGELARALGHTEMITSWTQRKEMARSPGVIISPAGMLVGGASVFYNEEVATRERNGIAIVSFQAPGTPGRTLLEKGLFLSGGKPRKVNAVLKRFDLSSHAGKTGLLEALGKLKGSPKVIAVHGDEETAVTFAEILKREKNLDASAPMPGEVFEI